jgi:hypothetical protein
MGKICAVYSLNDFQLAFNGTLSAQDTIGTLPTVDRLFIGSSLSFSYSNGPIRRIIYWPQRLVNAKSQAVTQ